MAESTYGLLFSFARKRGHTQRSVGYTNRIRKAKPASNERTKIRGNDLHSFPTVSVRNKKDGEVSAEPAFFSILQQFHPAGWRVSRSDMGGGMWSQFVFFSSAPCLCIHAEKDFHSPLRRLPWTRCSPSSPGALALPTRACAERSLRRPTPPPPPCPPWSSRA